MPPDIIESPKATASFEDAVRNNMGRLVALARSLLGPAARDAREAEDLVQDALMNLFRQQSSYDWADGAWALMARVVSRNVISCRRRKVGQSLEASEVLSESLSESCDPAGRLVTRETTQRIRRAIESLPPSWHQALVLREQQGLGYREIASLLQASESQVKTWIHRARVRLADELKELLEE